MLAAICAVGGEVSDGHRTGADRLAVGVEARGHRGPHRGPRFPDGASAVAADVVAHDPAAFDARSRMASTAAMKSADPTSSTIVTAPAA